MNKLVLGLLAGVAGIALLLVGLFSNHWIAGRDSDFDNYVGLRSMSFCQQVQPDLSKPGETACSTVGFDEIEGTPSAIDGFDTFTIMAAITFYGGLACCGVVLLLVVLAVARKYPDLPIAPSTLGIVLSFGSVVMIALVLALHPWKKVGWGTGWSIMVAGGGAAGCLLASLLLGRLRPPVDDNWG
jgi:MFS family permease